MVVARDRYLAEDVCQRIRVDYEPLTPVVGIANARDRDRLWSTRTCPATSPAHMLQEVGDVEAAMAAAPHTLELDLDIERSACMPMEGKGVYARWDTDKERAAHLLLDPDLDRGARRGGRQARPAAGQGRVHRPRRGRRLRRQDQPPVARGGPRPLGRKSSRAGGEVDRGPARALHLQRARARAAAAGQGRLRRRGPDARARREVLARQRRLHALRHHRPDHHLAPSCSGPTSPAPTAASSGRSTPTPSSSRPTAAPAGRRAASRWNAPWTPSPTPSGSTAPRCGRATSSSRARCPTTTGCCSRTGGRSSTTRATSPPRSPSSRRWSAGTTSPTYRDAGRGARGAGSGSGIGCYVEGTGVGPYEGGHIQIETSGRVNVSTGLTSQGQGHETSFAQIVAQELGVPIERRLRHHRRHPPDALCRGHVRLPRGGDERQRDRPRRPQRPGQGAAHRGRRAGGVGRGPRDRRRHRPGQGRARHPHVARHRLGDVQPAALRLRRRGQGRHPVRRQQRPDQAARRRRRRARSRGQGLLLAHRRPPSPTACTRRSSRPTR